MDGSKYQTSLILLNMGLTPERNFSANRFVCSGFVAWPSNGDLWFNLEPETKSHKPSPQLPAPRPDVSDASLQAYKRQCITNVSVLCLRLSVSGGVLLVGQP